MLHGRRRPRVDVCASSAASPPLARATSPGRRRRPCGSRSTGPGLPLRRLAAGVARRVELVVDLRLNQTGREQRRVRAVREERRRHAALREDEVAHPVVLAVVEEGREHEPRRVVDDVGVCRRAGASRSARASRWRQPSSPTWTFESIQWLTRACGMRRCAAAMQSRCISASRSGCARRPAARTRARPAPAF